MKQHQKSQDTAPDILEKKTYSKPVLTVLGEVSELTTGGSTQQNESEPGTGGYFKNPRT